MKIGIFVLLLFFFGCNQTEKVKLVAVQPYTGFKVADAEMVSKIIAHIFHVRTVTLSEKEMYKNAFVQIKSPRYRADSIIRFQSKEKELMTYDYVIGLTSADISTTKKDSNGHVRKPSQKYLDWGVMGLAFCPGNSCVVSDFRLKDKESEVSLERLRKVAAHEFGHNLGLPHCLDKSCFMTDAVESINTIDHAKLSLCKSCKKKLTD